MKLQVDFNKALKIAMKLYHAYYHGEGCFGFKGFNESIIPKGIEKGSGDHIFFITLTLIIQDYQVEKKRQWLACKEAYEDVQTRYLFIPEKIRWSSVKKVKRDFEKYNLSQNPMEDARLWKMIASSMHLFFQSDPFRLLRQCDYDGTSILNLLKSYRYRRGFPFLKSRKLAPVWLHLLYEQGGLPIRGMDSFPLGVDIHIVRATLNSQVLKGNFRGSIEELKEIVDTSWHLICREANLLPLQIKDPLWYLGRYGCRFYEGVYPCSLQCPLSRDCRPYHDHANEDLQIEVIP